MMRTHSGSAIAPERLRRVAEDRDAHHALGIAVGDRAHDADDDPGAVAAERTVDGHQAAVVVEVVFGERPALARQGGNDLVRVHGPAAPRPQRLLGVVVERRQRLGRRVGDGERDPHARLVRDAERQVAQLAVRRSVDARLDQHLLEAQPGGDRGQRARDRRAARRAAPRSDGQT